MLFYSCIAALAIAPVFTELGVPKEWFALPIGVNLAIALCSSRNRLLIYGLFPLAAIIVSEFANIWPQESTISLGTPPLIIALTFLAAVTSFLHALHSHEVDAECIYAALSAYLLAGVCMGIGYWFVNEVRPGSFLVNGIPSARDMPFATLLYFSFMTLTTTGFGDIIPVTRIVRGLVMAEAILGQLYLASMLAALISIYTQRRTRHGT